MVANASVIFLVLLSHVAIISTSGVHLFVVGGQSFYSDFYLMNGGGSVIIDGQAYSFSLPVAYNQSVLRNATLNLISLIDYLKKSDPVLTTSQIRLLDNTRSLLVSMLQSGVFETGTIANSENTVVGIYLRSLSVMRNDKTNLLKEMQTYIQLLSSPGIPPKLQSTAQELLTELKKDYSFLLKYDYGIAYFYTQIYPRDKELVKRAEFVATYPQVYEELTAVKNVYSYLDSEGLLTGELKQLWLQNFSPMYVKFVRGLYVSPNVTLMEHALTSYLNQLKDEAEENLMKAKRKVDGYTNPPFYQKGKYEREIAEMQEQLSSLNFDKFNNETVYEVKTLVKIYKRSKELPSEVSHKYILDLLGTVVIMGVAVGVLLARVSP